ncbi:MAG TPA: GIY-YIG nuclease family protein [Gammaproteobacteria bacterium]|nr:GIY-YIG nuclease family protein [Gammaproteobacteria bacterium]
MHGVDPPGDTLTTDQLSGLFLNRSMTLSSSFTALPVCRGTYLLHLRITTAVTCHIGALGVWQLAPGDYAYVGSAFGPGGVRARVSHHLASYARPRWHLDYLRDVATISAVWYSCDPRRREALWSRLLAGWPGVTQPVPGFGASDCKAGSVVQSHLFWFDPPPSLAAFYGVVQKRAPRHAAIVAIDAARLRQGRP